MAADDDDDDDDDDEADADEEAEEDDDEDDEEGRNSHCVPRATTSMLTLRSLRCSLIALNTSSISNSSPSARSITPSPFRSLRA